MSARLAWAPPRAPSREVPGTSVKPGLALDPSGRSTVHWTSTARSALRPVLLHLRRTGALPDKNGEILMPQWVCTSLLNAVHKVCFPTSQDTPSLRGVLVYHQYGFPQRLDEIAQRCRDRGLFLIENAVNCVFDAPSPYGMGAAGVASIFSLPKMFGTVLGGALTVHDAELKAFCAEYFLEDEPWIGRLSNVARSLADSFPGSGTQRFQELTYALSEYGRRIDPRDLARVTNDLAGGAVASRRGNYRRLLREFGDTPFFQGLESDAVPYLAPLFAPPDFLSRLAARLTACGVETGVYRFDATRNVFEPRFVPCVPLPIHQGLNSDQLGTIIDIVRTEWRSHNGQR